jgi:hypothetical protein
MKIRKIHCSPLNFNETFPLVYFNSRKPVFFQKTFRSPALPWFASETNFQCLTRSNVCPWDVTPYDFSVFIFPFISLEGFPCD